jgi:hypothetical protein
MQRVAGLIGGYYDVEEASGEDLGKAFLDL